MGRKFGASAPFWGGGAGSPSNTKSLGPGDEAYVHTKRHLDPCSNLATTDMGRKLEGLCPFRGGGANTMWPRPRPTCMPNFILIRPTVWPQCTNVTERQTGKDRTGQDNGPIA